MKLKNTVITGAVLVIAAVLIVAVMSFAFSSEFRRAGKSFKSNVEGGLNRTVTVYSATGEKLAEYSGKIDVEANENKVLFDLDGKRTIIYNGTVIVQEK